MCANSSVHVPVCDAHRCVRDPQLQQPCVWPYHVVLAVLVNLKAWVVCIPVLSSVVAKSYELLQSLDSTKDLPIWIQTLAASFGAGTFRIALMPVDALKTTLQVEGAQGVKVLGSKIAAGGPFVLWHGALAASGATYDTLAYRSTSFQHIHAELLSQNGLMDWSVVCGRVYLCMAEFKIT